ncbi:MAG: CHAT domain-containing protein [Acidobacteriota bacterium]
MKITHAELAEKLASADADEQLLLLQNYHILVDLTLAQELRGICYESWYSSPAKTRQVISALNLLTKILSAPEVKAIAEWGSGIGEIINGKMRLAIEFLDRSESRFLDLKQPLDAAQTQVSKLYALAMLGLYDKALECGLRVREVFLQFEDFQAAGKIELNLGNIYQKRDQYEKAEELLRLAHRRFENTQEFSRLIQIDNSLANALSHQHKFKEAERIYLEALQRADRNNLQVLKAEIESNLGHLLLFQGRFDRALQFFESSRRRYAKMNMPHQSAIAEQEIADAYLELNLIPEAATIYESVSRTFAELELKTDKARALAYHARACIEVGENQKAHQLLEEAKGIYQEEKNLVGLGIIKLIEAKLYYSENNILKAFELVQKAEPIFTNAGLLGRALHARWLCGESLRLLQDTQTARKILENTLLESNNNFIPQITLRCYTSLGLLEKSAANFEIAKTYFEQAVAIVEEMRAPLPAEDFRMSFLADKLTPYQELMNLCLESETDENIKKAFVYAENARSRVLLEMLDYNFSALELSESRQDIQGLIKLEQLREEINWLYNQLNRTSLTGQLFDIAKLNNIQEQIKNKEYEFLEIKRKQKIFADSEAFSQTEPINLPVLQNILGKNTALIEFLVNEGGVSAFIITDERIKFQKNICRESEITENLESLNLQIDRMRFQLNQSGNLGYGSNTQTRQILQTLYQLLIKPLENLVGLKNLIIVPQKSLHYVPFQALFDGFSYLIETREVSYAPSARIFMNCFNRKNHNLEKALFIGANDELTPNVTVEIENLSKIFPDAKVLINKEASRQNLQKNSRLADIVHFACHGKFRPDNPLFSALKLSDGWFNVGDAYTLDLKSSLVVLSACETGINSIAVGDEILGLARGFFSAGASSIVLSLWQIDDAVTEKFMACFYEKLKIGLTVPAALRMTQIQIMQQHPHPFFWSPFIQIGSF